MLMITEYCIHGDLLNFLRSHAHDFMASIRSVDEVEEEAFYKNMSAQHSRLRRWEFIQFISLFSSLTCDQTRSLLENITCSNFFSWTEDVATNKNFKQTLISIKWHKQNKRQKSTLHISNLSWSKHEGWSQVDTGTVLISVTGLGLTSSHVCCSDSGISCCSEYQEMQPVLSPGQTHQGENLHPLEHIWPQLTHLSVSEVRLV